MNQGRGPAGWGPVRVGAQALTIFAVAAFGTAGVALAAPPADPGPPEHAQGNGPPATTPAAPQGQANGQARKKPAPAGGQVQSGGDAHGRTDGGHAKARGKGHTGTGGGSGGQAGSGKAKSGGGSEQAKAGKVTLCHATGSATNPYVMITISANAVSAHESHQDGRDIIPAPAGGCPGGSSGGGGNGGNENENGKVTICHATGSETNPYVVITISESALEAHLNHQDGQDIYPVPAGGCPSTALSPGLGNPPSGILTPPGGEKPPAGEVLGVSEESGAPGGDEGEGAVLGANQGGGEAAAARETTGSSLPFTGLGLGLLAAIGLALALSGRHLRRKAS